MDEEKSFESEKINLDEILSESEFIVELTFMKNSYIMGLITSRNKLHIFNNNVLIRSIKLDPFNPDIADKKESNNINMSLTP